MQKPKRTNPVSTVNCGDNLPFLPNEVWLTIFEFALQSDLRCSRNIQLVCRLWHSLLCFDLFRAKNKVKLISDNIYHALLFELEQKARLKRRSSAPRDKGHVRWCLFTIARHIDYVDASPLALNKQSCHDVQQSVQDTFLHHYRPNSFERCFFEFEYFKTLTARLGQTFFKLALPQESFEKYELISRHTRSTLAYGSFGLHNVLEHLNAQT